MMREQSQRPEHASSDGDLPDTDDAGIPDGAELPGRPEEVDRRLRAEIAELNRAAHAARLSEQRLAMALDIVGMGAWDWDIVLNDIVWSENVEALYGLAPGGFDGRYESWLALVHPDDQARVGEVISRALSDGVGDYDFELRIRRPDGTIRWQHARGQVYYAEDGSATRMVGTVVDITERRSADEELRRARALAEAASAAKNAFLARMNHELRTPLNAVLGFAQLLEMDLVGEQLESVQQIGAAGRHLLDLINVNETLDTARMDSGEPALSPEPVLVAGAVAEAVELIRPLAAARNVSIAPLEHAGLDGYVVADRQQIKQVLLDLLSNAAQYSREGGTISVTGRLSAGSKSFRSICVGDSGPGMTSDHLERLPAAPERLGAEQGGVEGAGGGLAVTKSLVQAMGGELAVARTEGQGSVITVTLPTAQPSALEVPRVGRGAGQGVIAQEQRTTSPESTDAVEPRWQLLSIEDNGQSALLLERVVERRPGWFLTRAEQGRRGLELIRSLSARGPVDLVLLDLHLPDMHGAEVLHELRADPATAGTPVVVLSADATPGALSKALAGGANGFLRKPLVLAELLDILDTLADGRALPARDGAAQVRRTQPRS